MDRLYFAIENNGITRVNGDFHEIERFFGYGNVFMNITDANDALTERKKPKKHHLTDTERREMEVEQQKFGWSKFTKEEKAEIKAKYKYVNGKRVLKTIDDMQLEFARMMMRTEMYTE